MDASEHARCYEEVRADMLAAKRQYRRLKAVADYHREKAGIGEARVTFKNGQHPSPQVSQISKRFRKFKQIAAAEAVLREAGAPMKTADIADAMLKDGFPATNVKILRNAIFTGMTRKPSVFRKTEAGTWSLATPV